jgi:hypothetical protein
LGASQNYFEAKLSDVFITFSFSRKIKKLVFVEMIEIANMLWFIVSQLKLLPF